MLNYHDTKKGSLFWISKINGMLYNIKGREQSNSINTITLFHSNNYSIIKFTLKPFTIIH